MKNTSAASRVLAALLLVGSLAVAAPTLAAYNGFGTSAHVLTSNGAGSLASFQVAGGGGSGDVVGPASATDNALTRFDSTTGKLVQNSAWTLSDAGNLVGSAATGDVLSLTGATTGATVRLAPTGDTGTTLSTSGILHMDSTNALGIALNLYDNRSTVGSGPLHQIGAYNSAYNQVLLELTHEGTGGNAAQLRMTGPSPQIEFVENDQASPLGKYELQVQGASLYVNSRNAGDTAFENALRFRRLSNGGGIGYQGTTSGETLLVPAATASGTLTLPSATDTLVGRDTTDTLTNKTLVAPALGTPASGVATNLTGTAASLTSGLTLALKSATTTVDVSAATAPTTGQVLTATDSTHATWQTAGGFAWNSSITGTTTDGVTLTIGASATDGVSALKLVGDNTQSNQSALANLQLGTSANVMGLMIQGTGSATVGAVGTGKNHLTLWGNTASNANRALSVGNETSYTERAYINADGSASLANAKWSIDASGLVTQTPSGASTVNFITLPAGHNSQAFFVTGSTTDWESGSYFLGNVTSTTVTTGRTGAILSFSGLRSRTATSGSVTDNYNYLEIKRQPRQNGAGGTFVQQGSVAYFDNQYSQIAGTLTDSTDVLRLRQNSSSTGDLINGQTNSVDMFRVSGAGKITLDATNTAGGTTGAQTINKPTGRVNFAAAAATLVVTNSLVTTASKVMAMAESNDTTCMVKDVELASGSFTIRMTAACTAETPVGWVVFN